MLLIRLADSPTRQRQVPLPFGRTIRRWVSHLSISYAALSFAGHTTLTKPVTSLACMAVGHGGLYHSQSPEAFFLQAPGLKVRRSLPFCSQISTQDSTPRFLTGRNPPVSNSSQRASPGYADPPPFAMLSQSDPSPLLFTAAIRDPNPVVRSSHAPIVVIH
jgi:pyruvate/2-oxoglutarate/acetoin dehydrogenase E1 component